MPNAMVDTRYPHSDEAMRLRRMLDDDTADALPMRLWCWGIDTDRESGRFEADAKQLAQIVRFLGDAEQLLRSFLACEVITPTGNPNEYRINGWKRNAKYFKERSRLRKYNSTRGPRVENARDTRGPRVNHDDPYPSSSSSHSSSKNGRERAGAREDPPPPPAVRTMADARALAVPIEAKVRLFEHWQQEHARVHHSTPVLVAPSAGLESAARVYVHANGDEAAATGVITRFVESKHEYWAERQWALWLLEGHKSYEQARLEMPRKEFSDADIGF